jgi:DNA-binding transcriptional LysR family regulator
MDRSNPDLNLLFALDALLAEQNVTHAAARMRISQPALSAQLARLRALFDDPLLLPVARGMTPTKRALELQEPLRVALGAVRDLVERSRIFDPAREGHTFRIAATDYVQYALLLPLLIELRTSAPRVRVALRNLDSATEKQMTAGSIDLAFMTPATAPRSLRSRKLFDEKYRCIVRKNHPRVRRRISIEQFVELEHVIVSPKEGAFTTPVDAVLRSMGKTRRIALSLGHFLLLTEVVSRSDLIALAPERLLRSNAARLRIMPPPLPVEGFTIVMLWHDRVHRHPANAWLRERIAEFART